MLTLQEHLILTLNEETAVHLVEAFHEQGHIHVLLEQLALFGSGR